MVWARGDPDASIDLRGKALLLMLRAVARPLLLGLRCEARAGIDRVLQPGTPGAEQALRRIVAATADRGLTAEGTQADLAHWPNTASDSMRSRPWCRGAAQDAAVDRAMQA
jgi:hypothetical protein